VAADLLSSHIRQASSQQSILEEGQRVMAQLTFARMHLSSRIAAVHLTHFSISAHVANKSIDVDHTI
jgi:hypothetical protein